MVHTRSESNNSTSALTSKNFQQLTLRGRILLRCQREVNIAMEYKTKGFWLGICVAGIILLSTTGYSMNGVEINSSENSPVSSSVHAPIDIMGNAELIAYCAGNGTDGSSGNPFILEDFEVNAIGGTGIFLKDTDLHVIIRNCRVENNTDTGGSPYGISLVNCSNVNVTGKVGIGNAVGISIAYRCANITVTNNYCTYSEIGETLSSSTGIAVMTNGVGFETTNITISENNCTNNWYGILTGCENSVISNNNCTFNMYGINSFMSGNINNTIIGNDCSYSTIDGIRFDNSDLNNIIADNNCSYSGTYGIYLYDGSNNTISDNDCSNSDRVGIYLEKSLNNTVAWNDCSFGREGGINLDYSNRTFVLNNNCEYTNEEDGEPAILLMSSENNGRSSFTCL